MFYCPAQTFSPEACTTPSSPLPVMNTQCLEVEMCANGPTGLQTVPQPHCGCGSHDGGSHTFPESPTMEVVPVNN